MKLVKHFFAHNFQKKKITIISFYLGINLSIKVLQAGAWPLGPTQVVIPFAVPQEFEKSIRMVNYKYLIKLQFPNIFFCSLSNFITLILAVVN